MKNCIPGPDSLSSGFPYARFRRLRFQDRPSCPHCSASRVHRWGSFSGRRRYRCLTCDRTFSDFTGTPLAYLKHIDRWPAFCHCMLGSLSVRRTGCRLGVSKNTAFRWRHRLLEALQRSDTARFGPSVVVDETWFPFSEKGKRDLDRPPRRRALYYRHHMIAIWVFIARDDIGRVTSGVVGRFRPGVADLETALQPRLEPDAELISAFGPYGATGRLALHMKTRYRRAGLRSSEVSGIRGYIRALRRWLKRFRGVATRYLSQYLVWYAFFEMLGRSRAVVSGPQFLLVGRFP